MPKIAPSLLAALALAAWLPMTALADSVSLPPSRDTTLYDEDGARANGAGEHLFVGTNGRGDVRVALLAFDVASAIPPGSTITAMDLTLHMSRAMAAALDVSVHRVTADWGEAGSNASAQEGTGAPAETGDATWTHRLYDTETWTTPGGDYAATPASSLSVTDAGMSYTWSLTGLVSSGDAQAWLDQPQGNFGLLLRPTDAGPAKRFDSRENIEPTARPQLVVTFTPPAEPVGACCEATGACGFVLHAEQATACAGTYQGQGTSCSPNPCPQPTGGCCLSDAMGTCMALTAASCASMSGAYAGDLTSCAEVSCPAELPPFADPLPLLRVAQPSSGTAGGQAEYKLAMRRTQVAVHRDLPATTLWGFDDGTGASVPGPTVETFRGEPVTVTWQNDLRGAGGELLAAHHLAVDTCLHGADDGPPKTVVHLHGGHVPAAFDGYPEDAYPPGQELVYEYPNQQRGATLWYHDHALGITRLNVYMGLAGLYVVRDAQESALGLPSGAHEVPLVLMDRSFRGDGSLIYPETWQEHFFGRSVLVNGKVSPYLNVDRGKYRFRILNAANARTFRLSLDDGASFQVIGGDGGLLTSPITATQVTLAPAERAEIVIDFAAYPEATEIVLKNDAPAPFPGQPGVGVLPDVLKFVVGAASGHSTAVPATLQPVPPILESSAEVTRDFVLNAQSGGDCHGREWLINDLGWHDITEYPTLGTTEIWRFINPSGSSHPMHIHLDFFQVLDRQAFEYQGEEIVPIGSPSPLRPGDLGWKDTVSVGPGEMVRVITTFHDYTGNFVYHCHVLEHEDNEMMRQFVTVTECGDGVLGMPDETCDDGNQENGDRCPDGEGGGCQPAVCGDGFVWNRDGGSEVCDDAGESASCDADCSEAECGDGVVNTTAGEDCDPGDGEADDCDEQCHFIEQPDAGPGGQTDAGDPVARDAGEDPDDAATPGNGDPDAGLGDAGGMEPGDSGGGCGCRVLRPRSAADGWMPALLVAGWLLRRRSRRRAG